MGIGYGRAGPKDFQPVLWRPPLCSSRRSDIGRMSNFKNKPCNLLLGSGVRLAFQFSSYLIQN
jgi:hypothetical protein